jgi:hypothetical protein
MGCAAAQESRRTVRFLDITHGNAHTEGAPTMALTRSIAPEAKMTARAVIPQSVVFRTFVHETVVLNLDTGLYHGINPTGGRMLEALSQVGVIGDVAVTLAAEFEMPLQEIQHDLWEFCEGLASRGLLVIEPS